MRARRLTRLGLLALLLPAAAAAADAFYGVNLEDFHPSPEVHLFSAEAYARPDSSVPGGQAILARVRGECTAPQARLKAEGKDIDCARVSPGYFEFDVRLTGPRTPFKIEVENEGFTKTVQSYVSFHNWRAWADSLGSSGQDAGAGGGGAPSSGLQLRLSLLALGGADLSMVLQSVSGVSYMPSVGWQLGSSLLAQLGKGWFAELGAGYQLRSFTESTSSGKYTTAASAGYLVFPLLAVKRVGEPLDLGLGGYVAQGIGSITAGGQSVSYSDAQLTGFEAGIVQEARLFVPRQILWGRLFAEEQAMFALTNSATQGSGSFRFFALSLLAGVRIF